MNPLWLVDKFQKVSNKPKVTLKQTDMNHKQKHKITKKQGKNDATFDAQTLKHSI